MELVYDPDEELTSEDFQRLFPDLGDLGLDQFSDDALAYRYSCEYKRCVFNVDSMQCVYCARWDH